MTTFIVDALDFLHLNELPQVMRSVSTFEQTYEEQACPLFQLLHRKITMFGQFTPKQVQRVRDSWLSLTLPYVRSKSSQSNPSTDSQLAENYLNKKISESQKTLPDRLTLHSHALKLSQRRRCDVQKLL